MGFGKKIAGLSLSILMLTYEFHAAILVLALADSQTGAYAMSGGTGNIEFLRRQLEKGAPPEGPLLERSYVVPSKVNRSLADKIWLTIAPLISLGYDERGIVNALSELGLPERIEVEGIIVLPDYANLCILRNLENGEIYVDIPIICNSTLSSTYYEVKGIKKHIKLYNVTSLKYYDVSLNACELYNVTYRKEVGEFSKAILNLNGDLKNNVINIYFPDLESPVFSELRIDFPSYGITLSLKVLERRVQKFNLDGKETDCSWIHVNRTLRASRDVWGVMLGIGHGGGWIPMLWLILRKGEYVSDHWIRWIEGERLAVEFSVKEFKSIFVLNFNKTANTEKAFLSKVLSEDELKSLLEQTPFEKLNLSRTPKGWNVRFIGEEVTNEMVWVTRKKYEQLARLGWREGNSIFIDSGETEWEYTVTNRDLGKCKSIRLFYNPLKVNRGELVHGLTLRNYANANVSYMLRLRMTSNYFFFFFKVEEGNRNIIVNKAATSSVLLVQQEPAVGDAVLELVKDGRVVTAVKVSLMLKATVFWKGFWDGLASKLPGIIVTAGVMIAMSFLIPHAYVRPAYYLLLSLGVLMNLVEVAFDIEEAHRAREEMLELAKTFENRQANSW